MTQVEKHTILSITVRWVPTWLDHNEKLFESTNYNFISGLILVKYELVLKVFSLLHFSYFLDGKLA